MSGTSHPTFDERERESLDIEELFATEETDLSLADDARDADTGGTSASRGTASGSVRADPADTTADELFQQLRDEQEPAVKSATSHDSPELVDESPEEIMARADAAADHVDTIDDSIRADDDALDDLLLTERREANGFLWIETDGEDASETDTDSATPAAGTSTPAADSATPAAGSSTPAAGSSTPAAGSSTPAAGSSTQDTSSAGDLTENLSLASGVAESFEERAATFDEANAQGASTTSSTASTVGSASTPGTADTDASADDGSGDDSTTETTGRSENTADSTDEPSDESGLAARIRSILSG